jgi:AmmeMemoRadiSam system protein A/AmmeMemoRadiSam system protein B
MENICPQMFRGTFYGDNKEKLSKKLTELARRCPIYLERPRMLFVPHAAYDYCASVATSAYVQLRGQPLHRVFILADKHSRKWEGRGVAMANFSSFQIFDRQIFVDLALFGEWQREFPQLFTFSKEAFQDHVIEVQLPMLQQFANLEDCTIVPLIFHGTSEGERQWLAETLQKQLGKDDLVIISSDLSHFFSPRLTEMHDRQSLRQFLRGDLGDGENCLCSPEAFHCAQMIARQRGWVSHFLNYGHSAIVSVDATTAVGYGALAWTEQPIVFPREMFPLLNDFSLQCIRNALENKELPSLEPMGRKFPQLYAHQDVFVTLKRNGHLRGCIGSLWNFFQPIEEGIRDHALGAAFHDSRFPPVHGDELEELDAHVSILSMPQPLPLSWKHWISHLSKRHPKPGVILEIEGQTSTFLLEVWEEIPEVEDFLNALCQKQGKAMNRWKEKDATLFIYDTHGENNF